MKAYHHHQGATRVKIYHGRSHTKKQWVNKEYRQSIMIKKARKKKGKAAKTYRPEIIFTHYYNAEKQNHPYSSSNPSPCHSF